jgi:hypothetical protein
VTGRRVGYVLLVLAAVAPLLVPLYDRTDPTLFGFPFYYWCQLGFVLLAMLALTVFRLSTRRRR